MPESLEVIEKRFRDDPQNATITDYEWTPETGGRYVTLSAGKRTERIKEWARAEQQRQREGEEKAQKDKVREGHLAAMKNPMATPQQVQDALAYLLENLP